MLVGMWCAAEGLELSCHSFSLDCYLPRPHASFSLYYLKVQYAGLTRCSISEGLLNMPFSSPFERIIANEVESDQFWNRHTQILCHELLWTYALSFVFFKCQFQGLDMSVDINWLHLNNKETLRNADKCYGCEHYLKWLCWLWYSFMDMEICSQLVSL